MRYIWLLSILVSAACPAAPNPNIVPGVNQWTVDVRFEHLRQLVVRDPGGGSPAVYWYVLLNLTNNTGRDVDFYPVCELMTDTFEIVPAGEGVEPQVFQRIKLLHQAKHPFLEPLEGTGNKILQGSDNARDIAVIWRDFDAGAGSVKLFISGLSNETTAVDHPVARKANGGPVKVFLRKTLELNYGLRGDTSLRLDLPVNYDGKLWVMR
jgi:hypothetical protein